MRENAPGDEPERAPSSICCSSAASASAYDGCGASSAGAAISSVGRWSGAGGSEARRGTVCGWTGDDASAALRSGSGVAAYSRVGVFHLLDERASRASSAMAKNEASSPISPSIFHFLPVREMAQLRLTRPETIHFCRVDSSRQVLISPSSRRMSQVRSPSSASISTLEARDSPGSGVGVERSSRPLDDDAATFGTGVAEAERAPCGRPRTLNMWPHVVHLTVTPPGLSLLSSSSYSV